MLNEKSLLSDNVEDILKRDSTMNTIKTQLDAGWVRVIIYMLGLVVLSILFLGAVRGHLTNTDIHMSQEEKSEIAVLETNVKNIDGKIDKLEEHITREFQTLKTFINDKK